MAADSRGTELEVGDICRYQGDSNFLDEPVPDELHGDLCTIRKLGPSRIEATVEFEDEDSYRVNTSALLFRERPAKKDKEKKAPNPDEQ